MESWKRIGGATLGGLEGVALYYFYCLAQNLETEPFYTFIWAFLGTIIGAIVSIVTVIVFIFLLAIIREASNRDNPRKELMYRMLFG